MLATSPLKPFESRRSLMTGGFRRPFKQVDEAETAGSVVEAV